MRRLIQNPSLLLREKMPVSMALNVFKDM
jgi:hypothetical protein